MQLHHLIRPINSCLLIFWYSWRCWCVWMEKSGWLLSILIILNHVDDISVLWKFSSQKDDCRGKYTIFFAKFVMGLITGVVDCWFYFCHQDCVDCCILIIWVEFFIVYHCESCALCQLQCFLGHPTPQYHPANQLPWWLGR